MTITARSCFPLRLSSSSKKSSSSIKPYVTRPLLSRCARLRTIRLQKARCISRTLHVHYPGGDIQSRSSHVESQQLRIIPYLRESLDGNPHLVCRRCFHHPATLQLLIRSSKNLSPATIMLANSDFLSLCYLEARNY